MVWIFDLAISIYLVYIKGISRVSPKGRINPVHPLTFTCFVQGSPVPEDSDVTFYFISDEMYNSTGISKLSTAVNGSERMVLFIVEKQMSGLYACVLEGFAASYQFNVSYYGNHQKQYHKSLCCYHEISQHILTLLQ